MRSENSKIFDLGLLKRLANEMRGSPMFLTGSRPQVRCSGRRQFGVSGYAAWPDSDQAFPYALQCNILPRGRRVLTNPKENRHVF
jgi:hypothetical protein